MNPPSQAGAAASGDAGDAAASEFLKTALEMIGVP